MRVLKPLLTALIAVIAIIGGLVVSLLVALTTAGVVLARRALGSKATAAGPAAPPARAPSRGTDDAIDVVATEVPVDSSRR